jgi:hypothetical protein
MAKEKNPPSDEWSDLPQPSGKEPSPLPPFTVEDLIKENTPDLEKIKREVYGDFKPEDDDRYK